MSSPPPKSNMEPPHHHCPLHHHHHHHLLFIHPNPLFYPHPHPHHHHHHHILPQSNYIPQNSNIFPNTINLPPQIPQSAVPPNLGFEPPHSSKYTINFQDHGLDEVEDDEEPIFMMTDEWREFFAKSEAKRREAKKLAKKKGKT